MSMERSSAEGECPGQGLDPALELIARIVAGERQLFHELIRPVERQVFVMLRMLLKDDAEAEDVAQETMIKVYRHLGSFRGESKFKTWVLSIARNEGLARLKKVERRAEETLIPEQDEPGGDWTPALLTDWREVPLEALERKELGKALQAAVMGLPGIYREVVELRDVEELNVEETAKLLGVTENVVKVRLHRARLMLQKTLTPVLQQHAGKRRGWLGWLR